MPVLAAVPVSAMHEQVHDGAGENEQPGQRAKDVGAMLGQQKEQRDGEEAERHQPRPRPPESGRLSLVMIERREWALLIRTAR